MSISTAGSCAMVVRSMRGCCVGQRRDLVDDRLVSGIVVAHQHVDEHLAIVRAGREPHQRPVAGHTDLPQHQIGGRIDAAPVQHQLAGFEVLAAIAAGIDAEVRVQAIFGRDARLHVRVDSLRGAPARSLRAARRRTRRDGRRTRRRRACPRALPPASPRPSAGSSRRAIFLRGRTTAGCARRGSSSPATARRCRRRSRRTRRRLLRCSCG